MFTWLVIIFVLALVFGIVKIESLKEWSNKALKMAKDYMDKLQNNTQKSSKDDTDNQQ